MLMQQWKSKHAIASPSAINRGICRGITLDETYFTKAKSKLATKDGKKLRGISKNKIGVGVACNETKSIFIVTGTSKPSRKSTKETPWDAAP